VTRLRTPECFDGVLLSPVIGDSRLSRRLRRWPPSAAVTTPRRHDAVAVTRPRANTENTKTTKIHEDNLPRPEFSACSSCCRRQCGSLKYQRISPLAARRPQAGVAGVRVGWITNRQSEEWRFVIHPTLTPAPRFARRRQRSEIRRRDCQGFFVLFGLLVFFVTSGPSGPVLRRVVVSSRRRVGPPQAP